MIFLFLNKVYIYIFLLCFCKNIYRKFIFMEKLRVLTNILFYYMFWIFFLKYNTGYESKKLVFPVRKYVLIAGIKIIYIIILEVGKLAGRGAGSYFHKNFKISKFPSITNFLLLWYYGNLIQPRHFSVIFVPCTS